MFYEQLSAMSIKYSTSHQLFLEEFILILD